jgi:hypothetical protein
VLGPADAAAALSAEAHAAPAAGGAAGGGGGGGETAAAPPGEALAALQAVAALAAQGDLGAQDAAAAAVTALMAALADGGGLGGGAEALQAALRMGVRRGAGVWGRRGHAGWPEGEILRLGAEGIRRWEIYIELDTKGGGRVAGARVGRGGECAAACK